MGDMPTRYQCAPSWREAASHRSPCFEALEHRHLVLAAVSRMHGRPSVRPFARSLFDSLLVRPALGSDRRCARQSYTVL